MYPKYYLTLPLKLIFSVQLQFRTGWYKVFQSIQNPNLLTSILIDRDCSI